MAASNTEYFLQPFPCFDQKWIRADLELSLRSPENISALWNNLVNDQELATNKHSYLNNAGNISYQAVNGKYYCGAEQIVCNCGKGCSFCLPTSDCNCNSCDLVDADDIKRNVTKANSAENNQSTTSDDILESWLWRSDLGIYK